MPTNKQRASLHLKILFPVLIILFIFSSILVAIAAWYMGLRPIVQSHCDPRTLCGRLLPGAPNLDSLAESTIFFAKNSNLSRLAQLGDKGYFSSEELDKQTKNFSAALADISIEDLTYTAEHFPEDDSLGWIVFYDRRDKERKPLVTISSRRIVNRWYIRAY